jgi:hypothetical protein
VPPYLASLVSLIDNEKAKRDGEMEKQTLSCASTGDLVLTDMESLLSGKKVTYLCNRNNKLLWLMLNKLMKSKCSAVNFVI